MSHTVALSFEDGVTRFITCADDQTVADAAYRARINIPVDCNDGACGTCKAFCESGTYDPGTYVEDALSADEASKGFCLPCQAKPTSDLVLQIRSTSDVAKTQAARFTGTVTFVRRYSPTVVGFGVEIPNRDKLAFLPGQYVNIEIPGTDEVRSYSFSTAPADGALEFLVKIVPGGAMSTWLDERAAEGDEVTFTGPHGSFFLREATRPALLLAGGTGLAPILAILRTLKASGSNRPVHLVYGATLDDDVVELDTLAALADELPAFTWDYCVADKATKAPNQGYVTALITDEHLADGDVDVYLCGPPPMVEAVRGFFDERGVEPTGFYYEKFTPAVQAAPSAPARAQQDESAAAPAPAPATPTVPGSPAPQAPTAPAAPAQGAATASTTGRSADEIARMRTLVGQPLFAAHGEGAASAQPLTLGADDPDGMRRLVGDPVFEGRLTDRAIPLDADDGELEATGARALVGAEVFPGSELRPLVEPTSDDGYEIGEEHPGLEASDALFEAREALELGALALVIGRLDSRQIAGYRLLAEATVAHVDGDRFVDVEGYIDTNAAFHDYLFTLTGNQHLLDAYTRLGVAGEMADALAGASWCHPSCTQDHLDIVDAVEASDLFRARELIIGHAERSKQTMRRAMAEKQASKTPKGITPGRFAGKVVLVTGAAQGIGEAVARRIHAEGGELVLADRSDLAEALAGELSASGPKAVAVLGDLETFEGAQAAVAAATETFGRLDIAIHNVGGTIWAKPYEHYTPDQIIAEVNRSLYPTLWGCRAALPVMIAQGHGTIVNVSSIATASIHRVPYAAAKGGVNAITRSLAMEAAPHGIRVVAAAAGGTEAPRRRVPRGPQPDSEQEKQWYQAIVDQTVDSSLLKRYGTLDEQAAPLCFLASDEASYITGVVLPVGGGDRG